MLIGMKNAIPLRLITNKTYMSDTFSQIYLMKHLFLFFF